MDGLFVEEVAASLVREFLSRKGLKKTCVTMDQEHPRSDLSINSRHDLRKVLHLEFLYRENKAKENPLKTSLELITRYFLDRSDSSSTQETLIPALPIPKKSNRLPLRCSESTLVNIYDLEDEDTRWRTSLSEASKARNDRLMPDKVDDELGALRLEDVEDELVREEVILSPGPSVLRLRIASEPIDLALAKEIKTLLFGSAFCCFNEEWKLQSFSFNDTASLKYGIVQNKGGPCGVLAAVQSCVLQKLLFEGESGATCPRYLETPSQSLQQSDKACLPTMMFVPMKRLLQPSDAQRTRCLALAIADILWRAGSHQRAVVTLASGTQQFSPMGKYKADGVLETLMLYSLTCYEDLVTFLQHRVQQFEAGPYGCILLTLSAILSRSPELVRQDFDVPTSHLIGAHGYCTQELVNLLLTGRAVSNVFNDVVELDSGDGRITLLRGIAARSDVGFLSLFEHYNVCQVGCFLKTPRFPIWVVCSESHFSVLFSLQLDLLSDWRAERLFDLYYYDGLANQQEQIRLTVDTTQATPEDSHKDLVPPLELCIRTKWKGASVNWNGSDPIL
ncbi:probable ubiquitin carboxyl-terminal hydrolase MINDY-4 isoform X4 [Perognathus longimembris pacificus]|uniref:probable ubiquitin carboxyl-terminal hydrolase MINDY-4 isoform X4 n=1 Tax=Perognathus longimembris pacificus TaxID=214514 RepID=UPI0020189767|nr:probable ubiquitin carboxyl-terminal hydrolase MINDY-4 isoform X4 [Perognathus longimembris pacificus]